MLKLKLIKKEPLKLKITSSFPSIILANLQDKTVTPSEEEQIIIADEGFDGLNQVTVEAVIPPKYTPKFISFQTYSGDNLKYEISNLDTSNIKNMSNMFSNCGKLTELDLSDFDTTNVTDMSNMFYFCRGLTKLDLSVFNTSNVTNMSNMFYNCSALTKLDLSSFYTTSATYMGSVFYGCNNLTELDISNFDTSNVINMSSMFQMCQKLKTLDLSSFNTEKVTNNKDMFRNCSRLTKVIINNPSMFKLTADYSFAQTPIAGVTNQTGGELGYVYVPDNLVETYKLDQYWSAYASQIKGISELPNE